MDPITRFLSLIILLVSLLATTTTPAPLSTFTTCTTTTLTPPASPGPTTTTTVGSTSTSLTLTTTTITMPSSTATSYTTVTAPVPTGSTVPEWGQCGGLGYAGPTACEGPFVCVCTSAWWCQCQAATSFEGHDADAGEPSWVFQHDFITSTYWPSGGVLATSMPASEPLRAR